MLIDNFTVVAQIVNFLILVLLLRRFLYGPIVNAMRAREDRIRERMNAAEEKREEAEQAKADYRRKKSELEERSERTLAEAREEAVARRKQLMAEARADVDKAQAHWREAVQRETQLFLDELSERSARAVIDIARRSLTDLADGELETQMIRVFIRRLRELDADQRAEMLASIRDRDADRPLLVQSAFELPEETRADIGAVVEEIAGEAVPLEFVTDRAVRAGIELTGESYHVAWSLNEHLAALEQELAALLAGEAQ